MHPVQLRKPWPAESTSATRRRTPPWLQAVTRTVARLPVVALASGLLVIVSLPVLLRGAPFADDLHNCVQPQRIGLLGFLSESWDRLGAVRPARFLEILLTTGVCQRLPFGVAIAVPLALTIVVAVLLRGLLMDLRVGEGWADAAAVAWLLQPLGTEAALWPAALHVPLGLCFALASLRLFVRGRVAWGAVLAVGASLCIEQAIFALPLAAALLVPRARLRTAAVTGTCGALVATAYVIWPGHDPRLAASVATRASSALSDPGFLLGYPAVGLGLQSMPMAAMWAFPVSVVLLVAGTLVGAQVAARTGRHARQSLPARGVRYVILSALAVIALANVPVLLAVPRQGSPRIFTPTWLVLVAAGAVLAARLRWSRPRFAGAVAGCLAVAAVLSIALSVSVRARTGELTEASARWIAATAGTGHSVVICGVQRTAVTPAPRGAFATTDLLYDYSSRDAVYYYTGRTLDVQPHEAPPGPGCRSAGADLTVDFAQLQRVSGAR